MTTPLYKEIKSDEGVLQERWCFDEKGEVLEGESTRYYDDGSTAETLHFHQGKLHGPLVSYDEQGHTLHHMSYAHGVLDGEARFYQKGLLHMVMHYQDGQPHGACMVYFPNEKPHITMMYEKSLKQGDMIQYNEQGQKTYTCGYKDDKKEGVEKVLIPETGKILKQTPYLQDQIDGEVLVFYPSGDVQSRAFYKGGQCIEGPIQYDTKGKVVASS